ncbi:MAG: hypothetical protein ACLP7J_18690 [Streptosporangiaceae bacterium]
MTISTVDVAHILAALAVVLLFAHLGGGGAAACSRCSASLR